MWATVLAMIALKENLAVLLLSVVPVAPVHEQSLAASHAPNVLSRAPNQSVTAMEREDQDWTVWL